MILCNYYIFLSELAQALIFIINLQNMLHFLVLEEMPVKFFLELFLRYIVDWICPIEDILCSFLVIEEKKEFNGLE